MSSITYFVVIPFDRNVDGDLIAEEPVEARSAEHARFIAARFSQTEAGALAFTRTGDPDRGVFAPATILARYSDVPVGAVCG